MGWTISDADGWSAQAYGGDSAVRECVGDLPLLPRAAETRWGKQSGAILPLDHDHSPRADTGYTGWVVLPDGVTIFVVNYIVDDAPMAQIRGYYLYERMF